MDGPIRLHGRFNDGRHATSEEVIVEAATDGGPGATIRGAGQRVIARWPREDVRLLPQPAGQASLRLRCGADDARLMLPADTDREALFLLFPQAAARDGRRSGLRIAILTAGAVAAVATVMMLTLPQIADSLARLVPPPVARQIGGEMVEQLGPLFAARTRTDRPYCGTPESRAALDALTARLTENLALPFPVTVHVLATPIPNAVALPGGHVVLFSSLIAKTDAEGLAGVLAHEIGHVAGRHPMAAAIESAGLALLAGVVLGDITGGGMMGLVAQSAIGASYSRDAETEADEVAVRLLNQANIRGRNLADFLAGAAARESEDSWGYSIFSTHPATHVRAEQVRRLSTGVGRALTSQQWWAIEAMCGAS